MDGVISAQLIVNATAAAGLAKTGVDVIRTQQDVPQWASPLAALILSFVILVAIFEANGSPLNNRQTIAAVFLGAFIAMPLAIGATAVQSAVERKVADQKVSDVASINVERTATMAAGIAAENVAGQVLDQVASQSQQAHVPERVLAEASRRGAQLVIDELRASGVTQPA